MIGRLDFLFYVTDLRRGKRFSLQQGIIDRYIQAGLYAKDPQTLINFLFSFSYIKLLFIMAILYNLLYSFTIEQVIDIKLLP